MLCSIPAVPSFHSVFHSFHGLMNSINWPASSVWVFIAQPGEHCSANVEATGSNPVEAPKIFFSGYFRNCLNCDSLRWSLTHFRNFNVVHLAFTSQHDVCRSLLKTLDRAGLNKLGVEFTHVLCDPLSQYDCIMSAVSMFREHSGFMVCSISGAKIR